MEEEEEEAEKMSLPLNQVRARALDEKVGEVNGI